MLNNCSSNIHTLRKALPLSISPRVILVMLMFYPINTLMMGQLIKTHAEGKHYIYKNYVFSNIQTYTNDNCCAIMSMLSNHAVLQTPTEKDYGPCTLLCLLHCMICLFPYDVR